MPDGTFVVSGDMTSPNTYWSTGRRPQGAQWKSKWAVRQTTCGADPETDECSVTRPFAFAPEIDANGTVACTLRTEAVIVIPMMEFLNSNIPTETTMYGGSSFRTFVWTTSIVEVASSSPTNATYGVNVFEWRITHNAFSLSISPAGAVIETLAVGSVAPPMFVSVVSTQGISGGPSSHRLMNDGRVRMIWQTNAYVQQKNLYASSRRHLSSAPTQPDTVLDIDAMSNASFAPSWLPKPGFTAECSSWVSAEDGATLPPGEDSTIACKTAGCVPIAQNMLPATMFMGITQSAAASELYWLQYVLKIVCYITPDVAANVTTDIVLPETYIRIAYALKDATSGDMLTDAFKPPFSQFDVQSTTLYGSQIDAIAFNLSTRLVVLPEDLISNADVLNDLFEDPESLKSVDSELQYSQVLVHVYHCLVSITSHTLISSLHPHTGVRAHGADQQHGRSKALARAPGAHPHGCAHG